jgi:hypothetical protein
VIPSGPAATAVSGTYLQTTLFPPWLTRLLSLLIILAIVFITLWFLAHPMVHTTLTENPNAMGPAQVQTLFPRELR